MKFKYIYLSFISFFLILIISGFSIPKKGKKITKKRICKTWFVGEAYEIKRSGRKKDQSNQAKGSIFIFQENDTFQLIDNSRRNLKTTVGKYFLKENDSIILDIGFQTLRFKATLIKKDSLTLFARDEGRSMFIGLSLDSISPVKKEDLKPPKYYESEEKEVEVVGTEEDYDDVPVPDIEIEKEDTPQNRVRFYSQYELIGNWQAQDSSQNFKLILSYNHFSEIYTQQDTLRGSWTVKKNMIIITNKKGKTHYKITDKQGSKMEVIDVQTSNKISLIKKSY